MTDTGESGRRVWGCDDCFLTTARAAEKAGVVLDDDYFTVLCPKHQPPSGERVALVRRLQNIHDAMDDHGNCPYFRRGEDGQDPHGICGFGCRDEPACQTCYDPAFPYPSQLLRQVIADLSLDIGRPTDG